MGNISFNAANVEPSAPLEPIPSSWYNVVIEESEVKPTSKKDGSYIELELKVLGGDYDGRKVFARLNIANPNPVAERIGQEQLSAICHAVGQIELEDTTQLHGKPFQAKVSYVGERKDKDDPTKTYEPSNEVKGFKALEGDSGQAPADAAGAPWANETAEAAPAPAPAAPPPPSAPKPAAPAAPAFPPEGWTKHPDADGYYYKGNEVVSEEDLRKMCAPAAVPTPPAPPKAPAAPAAQGNADVPPWAQ